MSHDLLILGASARAAAFSALRCGLRPRCADYFADRDLAAVCPVDRIDLGPDHRGFVEFAEAQPSSPWLYTGGFENDPECVERISRKHILWGMDAETLRAIRDPARVAGILTRNAILCPKIRADAGGLPRDASWLKKPLASGGGRGIEPLTDPTDTALSLAQCEPRHWRGDGEAPAQSPVVSGSHGGSSTRNVSETAAHGTAPSNCYFQERIDGPSFSALYLGDRSRTRLIGVTRQLIGIEGSPFGYRGSFGPVATSRRLTSRLESLGNVLTSAFGLAGWFGIDFILRDGDPWPVEVNPRYTASLEIHELAWERALLPMHRDMWDAVALASPALPRVDVSPKRIVAKWILHASQKLVAPAIAPDEDEENDLFAVPSIADIPWPGTTFNCGEPVMTLMAAGKDLAECISRLARLERVWTDRLGIASDHRALNALLSDRGRSRDGDVL